MSHNYWVVGAMLGGQEDQLPLYVRRGYWRFYNPTPKEQESFAQFKPGDRIAVKRMLGQASTDIEIRALGIITDVEPDERAPRAYVRWVLDSLTRVVPSKGCFATIHGPFAPDNEWTKTVFQL